MSNKLAKVNISVKAGGVEVKLVSKNTVKIITDQKEITVGRETLETLLESIDDIVYAYREDFGDSSVFDPSKEDDED